MSIAYRTGTEERDGGEGRRRGTEARDGGEGRRRGMEERDGGEGRREGTYRRGTEGRYTQYTHNISFGSV